MGSLVRFMVRSRTHAIATAVIGMLLPPFSFVTGGIIGLTVLRYGLADGALVLAVSASSLKRSRASSVSPSSKCSRADSSMARS